MLTLTTLGREIEEYALSKTEKHSNLLKQLMAETHASMEFPQMLTGPVEGQFLKMMVLTSKAKTVLEIGTYTGYSALSMAQALPRGGKLYTMDLNPKSLAVAKRYFEMSDDGSKIEIVEGDALTNLKKLEGPFDLVFIDADKGNYKNYYEAVLPKMQSGGIILVDNVLWSGAVLDPKTDDDKAIVAFNEHVASDDRVEKVLLTIRDGVYFIRKI
ncbi:MAG: class I SAM-dependent methyltransferase [Cyanobacteria bacterium TGS_CYA1]|nr:class I SAM-dependent methyltransferase [Cyanobacteria bacterium TGS_CYA1]